MGSRTKLEALGVLMGSLEFDFSKLWLGYCAIVFVCLMQLVSYMLWMRRSSMTLSSESKNRFYM